MRSGSRMWFGFVALVLCSCGARTTLDVDPPCVASSTAEVCDGLDNDCDGQIDEDIPLVRCGVGACEAVVQCEGGAMPLCVPREPEPEACNLLDDNCNGLVDEGFGFGPVGEALYVRTDEFDTGPCGSCRWAWGTSLAPRDDGLVALWNLGLSGGDERPTLYRRPVDRLGHPVGPIALDRDDFLLELQPMLALPPMPAKGLPMEATYRVGSDDVPGLLFVSASGMTETTLPIPGGGPRGVPRTVWTGERFVTAWEEDDALHVAVLTADGALDHTVDVDPLERPAAITVAAFPGRVAILVSRYRADPERRDQWLILLDSLGQVVSPAHAIDVAYASWQRLVGTDEGWLHIRPNGFEEPSTRQPLDVEGNPVAQATPFPDGRHFQDSGLQDTFVPRPGLGEMMVAWQAPEGGLMHVEALDGRGEVRRGWSGPLAPDPGLDQGFVVTPHLTFVDDRVLVIWGGGAIDGAPNPVSVRAFGCVSDAR